MKRLIIIILVVTIECCFLVNKDINVFIEKADLKLHEREMGIVFFYHGENKVILLKTIEKNILLVINLSDSNWLKKVLDNFNSAKIDYTIDINNMSNNVSVGDIVFVYKESNLKISYQNHNFCYYQNNAIDVFNDCNYVYLTNPSASITFNKEPELILYSKLNDEFLEKMYDRWIDTYCLDKKYYTIVKLNDQSFNLINIPI